MYANLEPAEGCVYSYFELYGLDSEMLSDTGTVENLLDMGLTLRQIEDGQFTRDQLEEALAWLD